MDILLPILKNDRDCDSRFIRVGLFCYTLPYLHCPDICVAVCLYSCLGLVGCLFVVVICCPDIL